MPSSNGEYSQKEIGELLHASKREKNFTNPTLEVTFKQNENKTIYISYFDEGSVPFSLILWTSNAFFEKAIIQQSFYCVYYGIILVMIIYNLFLFFSIKDNSFLFYVLYTLSVLVLALFYNGLFNQYFLTNSSPWVLNRIYPTMGAVAVLFLMLYTKSFLQTQTLTPKWDKILKIFIFILLLNIMLFYTIEYIIAAIVINLVAVLASLLIIFFGHICVCKRF